MFLPFGPGVTGGCRLEADRLPDQDDVDPVVRHLVDFEDLPERSYSWSYSSVGSPW
jgi:hypothetical protein